MISQVCKITVLPSEQFEMDVAKLKKYEKNCYKNRDTFTCMDSGYTVPIWTDITCRLAAYLCGILMKCLFHKTYTWKIVIHIRLTLTKTATFKPKTTDK